MAHQSAAPFTPPAVRFRGPTRILSVILMDSRCCTVGYTEGKVETAQVSIFARYLDIRRVGSVEGREKETSQRAKKGGVHACGE